MTANRAALWFIDYTIAFTWFFICVLEYGEQPRMMFPIYSYLLIRGVILAQWGYRRACRHVLRQKGDMNNAIETGQ